MDRQKKKKAAKGGCKCNQCNPPQGLIQDILLGGGKPYFLRNFGNFRTVIIILVIVYSSAIDQFRYSHFVCLPVYHIH